MPYREADSDLDLDARESAATTAFGAWSARLRTLVLVGFAIPGIAAAMGVGALVIHIWGDGYQPRMVYVGPGGVVFVALMLVGRAVGRVLVRRATPAKLAALAKAYEVPVERLAATADLANRL